MNHFVEGFRRAVVSATLLAVAVLVGGCGSRDVYTEYHGSDVFRASTGQRTDFSVRVTLRQSGAETTIAVRFWHFTGNTPDAIDGVMNGNQIWKGGELVGTFDGVTLNVTSSGVAYRSTVTFVRT